MRASRLLRILLLLQNRGRMPARRLAEELEVTPRTILRDVDAMTEAGLPVIAHRGAGGGIELGFNYRSRLTGLDADEAEALGALLAAPAPWLDALGLGPAHARAAAKLMESLPDRARAAALAGATRFCVATGPAEPDPRLPALAIAVRDGQVIRIRARSAAPQEVHPRRLEYGPQGWTLVCARSGQSLALADLGDINISARRFAPP